LHEDQVAVIYSIFSATRLVMPIFLVSDYF